MYLFIYIAVFLPAIVHVSARIKCRQDSKGKRTCVNKGLGSHGGEREDALTRLLRQMDEAENGDDKINEAARQMNGEFDEIDEKVNKEANEEANEDANEMDEEAAEMAEEANEMDKEANEMDEEANEMEEEAIEMEEEANDKDQN